MCSLNTSNTRLVSINEFDFSKVKLISSKNIGILLSTKIGQSNSMIAYSLKDRIIKKWPDKKVFIFYCSDVNFLELENFNFIDIYINTACPRLAADDSSRSPKSIINASDVEKIL